MSVINTPTGVVDGQTDEAMKLTLTAKEELAVIVQRLRKHQSECANGEGKTLLKIAADLTQTAMHYRE